MSSTKDYYFDAEQARCLAWIKATYGIEIDPDEDVETWERMSAEYSSMRDAFEEEAEYRWLERHSHNTFFNEFAQELVTASDLLDQPLDRDKTQTLYKLVYAHSVTLLESLISSVVRSLVVSHPTFMVNIAKGYDDLSKKKFTLKEIIDQPKGMESIVLNTLSTLSFHNPSTIKTVMSAAFGHHMAGLDLNEISTICSKRHDIVHRNGRTIDDVPIQLDHAEVQQAILTIRAFATDLKGRIYKAVDEHEFELF
ncbi:HEPN domain-containing protein [Pseudomonas argentinensis]|uniref:HEPN domain-containing protein n=1 Tax=Phytopseudomonas argentinensis TaxID=289370 RepID=UPI0008A967C8|nr:HEPN domain-containing protein [Pseudomonas argentinensis]